MMTKTYDSESLSAIEIINLHHSFLSRNINLPVINGIDLSIHQEEFVCILGPSGCGKSTLLKLIACLLTVQQGQIQYKGRNELPSIGMMFQQSNLMPWRTVFQNVQIPLEINETKVDVEGWKQKVNAMISLVGLSGYETLYPRELSGGMGQRVALARALIYDPEMLLLDEPFGSLDALTREIMGMELLRIWQQHKKTVVMVTHSISEALLLADRVIVLSKRPAKIRLNLEVPFPRPRQSEMRYTPEFGDLAKIVRSEIEN